jgi:hypothetical protein
MDKNILGAAHSIFRQTDLKRAIKAALAAGLDIARIEIRDGVIVMVSGKLSEVGATQANEWDED